MCRDNTIILTYLLTFKGNPGQDPDLFLAAVDSYLSVKKDFNDKQRAVYYRLLLRAQAVYWFDGLSNEIRDDYAELTKDFKNRFCPHELNTWQQIQNLHQDRKRQTETIRGYIDRVKAESNKLKVVDEQQVHIILAGLPTDVRAFYIQQCPKDSKELIDAALLAECSNLSASSSSDTVLAALDRLEDQINSLTIGKPAFTNYKSSCTPLSPNRPWFRDRPQYTDRKRVQFALSTILSHTI